MTNFGMFNEKCLPLTWKHLSLDVVNKSGHAVSMSTMPNTGDEERNIQIICGTLKSFLKRFPNLAKKDSGLNIHFYFMDNHGKWMDIITCPSEKFFRKVAFAH